MQPGAPIIAATGMTAPHMAEPDVILAHRLGKTCVRWPDSELE